MKRRPHLVESRRTVRVGLLHRGRASLIRSMVEMAHALGAIVVVEGVENEDHRSLTISAGADLLQGFDIARPMAMPELLEWLDATQVREAKLGPA